VVIELTGGNDGLNTVVPYTDDEYHKLRPKLRLEPAKVLKIDDHSGFHPALAGFAKLTESNRLAVIQGVGYPNPNRSHFESMATWHTARLNPGRDTPGWLTRALAARSQVNTADAPAVHIGAGILPQAMTGGEQQIPSVASLEQFRRYLGIPEAAGAKEQRAALDEVTSVERGKPGSLLQFVERSQVLTYASSARLQELVGTRSSDAYPNSGLARRLGLVALMIKAELSTSLFYTRLDGFDTHSFQAGGHEQLLRELGDGVRAFLDDVAQAGHGSRVAVLAFSEFGRRVKENASAGTDHGAAGPVFLAGGGVKGGLHGTRPDLNNLDDGDVKVSLDFRRIYATLLDQWVGCRSEKVLGEKFEHLAILA
jgi:uncharacterized protein (DUF1501 family)